ncbi:Oidioi.mRNA.OKI2018_I69.PAR.g11733.t1.cds [Oikopleura dioica]|uniref:Oidioi.mRNA.OKI2018_I69.PAR.g11733.t1.cds n=1 Tax=Oikopleura dioica TaxID=34765 RepID=A0ABN7RX45_OIKDI|nr:Oidioi.mRNA.OKI2018_I69.PAR.g11733.t1.cds [Oikopleura dioica]
MTALVETTGLQRDLFEAMDIEELESLWKRVYLLQEQSSLSSDKMMDRVLDDEEKYAGIFATYEIDNIDSMELDQIGESGDDSSARKIH